MKKTALLILAMVFLSIMPVKADEGMWLLPLLEKLNSKKMAEMGFTLTADDIYNINHSSLKDAIVQFGGGCTGEIVSKNGLLFTNHHCGYGSIQKLSSVEHNYLKDGYWAMNLSEELPAQGLSVTFMESFTEVTKELNKIVADFEKAQKSPVAAQQADSLMGVLKKELDAKHIGNDKFLSADLMPFYGGNTFYYIVYKTYYDVRFVGAPPSSIGKFGADTDNWMWPRHTGDFSVFRVYADKDNNPAEYSAENIPYTPKQFLKISIKGVQSQDPTMIMGYPGSTNRFMTRSELIEQRDLINAISIHVRGIRQDVLMADMQADPKIMIQYASKYSGSSNGWKKNIGMNETFAKLGVEERRAAEEARFTEWMNKKNKRKAKYGNALKDINSAIEGRKDVYYRFLYLNESLSRVELGGAASRLASLAEKEDKSALASQMERFYKDYSAPTDRKVAKAMIAVYRDKVAAEYMPDFYNAIDTQFGGSIDAYVDNMFDNSVFTSPEKLMAAIEEGKDLRQDPAYLYSKSYMKLVPDMRKELLKDVEKYVKGKKDYIAATLEMREGEAIYPDANFTMRLTYGSVLPYSPRDGVIYNYYTTLDGVMEKEDPNNWEFVVPEKLKTLWKNQDYGQYGLSDGSMPVCFLSNNDITGGNSGSPIMNGNGELIGLAFDGNWESMSGDIIFEPMLQRCINVDIRYVLFIIDKFGGAGYLLDEMEIVK